MPQPSRTNVSKRGGRERESEKKKRGKWRKREKEGGKKETRKMEIRETKTCLDEIDEVFEGSVEVRLLAKVHHLRHGDQGV